MQDLPETPDERAQRRRVRRWKRRARILAPFLGLPILLAALALSVDMIEYVPQPPPDKLADRPIHLAPKDVKRPSPRPLVIDTDPGVDDALALVLALRSAEFRVELVTTVAGNVPIGAVTDNARRLLALLVDAPDALEDDGDARDLDVILPASPPPRPPTPPYASRRP